MDITPMFIIGLLLGAILGVFVTDMRPVDLREEAPHAFARSRLAELFGRRSGRPIGARLFWAASRMLRIEWIALLIGIWFAILMSWVVSAIRTPYLTDPDWLHSPEWIRDFLVGSLIGFASAPWVWLHFSRDLPSRQQVGNAGVDGVQQDTLARYRLQTIILGVVILFVTLGPRLIDMLRGANKVDVLGVSVSLSEHPGGPAQSAVLSASGTTGGVSAIDELNILTKQARLISNADMPPGEKETPRLENIGGDLRSFAHLSTFDRDRAYIAYFVHAADGKPIPQDITLK